MKKDYKDINEIYKTVSNPHAFEQGTEEEKKKLPHKKDVLKREYDHFVRQRRNMDKWGRMMLLKPDRKYKYSKFYLTHIYYVHEFLKNMFAISMLEESDFSDYNPDSEQPSS